MRILIKNARVVTPYEVVTDIDVVVADGTIESLAGAGSGDERGIDEIIDAKGNYLAPGFIDIHNHGNSGHDFMDGTFTAIDAIADFQLKNGVTSFLATTITSSKEDTNRCLNNVREYMEIHKNKKTTSQLLGVYLEGPFFNEEKKGAQPKKYIRNPNIKELSEFIHQSGNSIRIVSLAPELEGAKETIAYLKTNKVIPFAGHTNGTYEEIKQAIDLGLAGATHLFNGMRSFNHREPGVIGAVLTDERVWCELICDGIHVHKGAMKIASDLKGKDGMILVSDSMMATGLEEGEYVLAGQKVVVKDKAARIENSSLAGSTLTLNKGVYNMMKIVNVTLHDAVRMATLNPAKVLGISDKKGSIEVGKDADLIIFDDNIDITNVLICGQIVK